MGGVVGRYFDLGVIISRPTAAHASVSEIIGRKVDEI